VAKIYAVDDTVQVCRRRASPGLAASYDEFWAECGGARRPDRQWLLPLEVPRRSRAELRPCRRKEHERRYAMLDAWQPRLRAALEPAEADAAEAA
jgi:uncharacterized protein VirK/YbjX